MFSSISRLFSDRAGVFAPLFGLLATVVIAATGIGMDYARALNDRSDAQAVADAMVLAMGQSFRHRGTDEQAREDALRIYEAHYGGSTANISFDIRPTNGTGERNVSVTFPGSTETTLARILNRNDLDWQVHAAANIGIDRLEMVLLIDVSPPIMEKDKVNEITLALKAITKDVAPINLTMSITRLISYVPFAESVHFGFRYENWIQPSERKNFIACFKPDSIADRVSNVPKTKGTLLPAPDDYVLLDGDRHYLCPRYFSEVVLFAHNTFPLHRTSDELLNLAFGWGRGTDIALSWGWRLLTPSWRGFFLARPDVGGGSWPGMIPPYPWDYSTLGSKVLVLLTHGYPSRYDLAGDGYFRHGKINGVGEPTSIAGRMALTTEYARQTCEAIRDEGQIRVFVFGYDMPAANTAEEREALNVLQECPSNGGQYFNVAYGGLSDAFDMLRHQLMQIRLTE